MTRDLQERVQMFAEYGGVTLERIALTMKQIEEESPPPNPAKTTDARFESYRAAFGVESWELDALRPEYLNDLVSKKIAEHIAPGQWDERKAHIEHIRERLTKISENFDDAENNDDE